MIGWHNSSSQKVIAILETSISEEWQEYIGATGNDITEQTYFLRALN